MKVSIVINITPDNGSNFWNQLFLDRPDIAMVVWEGTQEGCTDLTVYYHDSDEPFPLTGLRGELADRLYQMIS